MVPGWRYVVLALELGQELRGEDPAVLVEPLAALYDGAAGVAGVELDAGQEHLGHRHQGIPGPRREPVFSRVVVARRLFVFFLLLLLRSLSLMRENRTHSERGGASRGESDRPIVHSARSVN